MQPPQFMLQGSRINYFLFLDNITTDQVQVSVLITRLNTKLLHTELQVLIPECLPVNNHPSKLLLEGALMGPIPLLLNSPISMFITNEISIYTLGERQFATWSTTVFHFSCFLINTHLHSRQIYIRYCTRYRR